MYQIWLKPKHAIKANARYVITHLTVKTNSNHNHIRKCHFCFLFPGIDEVKGTTATFLLVNAVVLLSTSSLSSSSSKASLAIVADSLAILAAFLFSAPNLACNFLATGSFEGPTLDWRETFAPRPSLQRCVMVQHNVSNNYYHSKQIGCRSQRVYSEMMVTILTYKVDPLYPYWFHHLQLCSYYLPIPQPAKQNS